VVTEEQFRHYQATGELPTPEAEAELSPPGDTPDPDEATTDGAAEDEAGTAHQVDSAQDNSVG
jgi:hypothetical protein